MHSPPGMVHLWDWLVGRLVGLPRERPRFGAARTPPSECSECTSRGEAGFPENAGSRRNPAECRCRSPDRGRGQSGRALVPLSQVEGLSLVALLLVALTLVVLSQVALPLARPLPLGKSEWPGCGLDP